MSRILLVEDESAIAQAVIYALETDNFKVEHCLLGRDALLALARGKFDVVILDVGLPDITGFEVCRELRKFSNVPVIFLTARDSEIDRVLGLELGADDYMVKPFSPRELVARIRARLRRGHLNADGAWHENGAFSHDVSGQRIRYADRELSLTRYEYRLLAALLHRPGAIFSREQLMSDVWRDATETVDRTVDTHIKTLRSKLKVICSEKDPIQTHRGLGYSLSVDL